VVFGDPDDFSRLAVPYFPDRGGVVAVVVLGIRVAFLERYAAELFTEPGNTGFAGEMRATRAP
jgi:hypothetical protein